MLFIMLSTWSYGYEFEVSICGIFQNEGPYLCEWIEYYKLLGVQHFYLYNNNSKDNWEEILEPYIEEGLVELIEWNFKPLFGLDWYLIQCDAYNNAIKNATLESKWLCIFDIDEYFVPCEKDNIVEFLKDYEDFGGLGVNWQMYGTSFVEKIPKDKLMIESLYLKAPTYHKRNKWIKSIIRPERVDVCLSPHHCKYKKGYFAVDSNKNRLKNKMESETILVDKCRLNHYWSKDMYFLNTVKLPRWKNQKFTILMMDEYDEYNAVEDKKIFKFVERLKEAMGFTKDSKMNE